MRPQTEPAHHHPPPASALNKPIADAAVPAKCSRNSLLSTRLLSTLQNSPKMLRPLFCIIPRPGNWEHNMAYLHDNYLILDRITLQNFPLASSKTRCYLLFLRNSYQNSILFYTYSPSFERVIKNLRPSIMESFEEPRVIIFLSVVDRVANKTSAIIRYAHPMFLKTGTPIYYGFYRHPVRPCFLR